VFTSYKFVADDKIPPADAKLFIFWFPLFKKVAPT
jgi:hypothetical protein